MAVKLGATFLRCTLGAVKYAGSCFQASRIRDGLGELSAESLTSGLTRGVAEIAALVGVPPREIERVLPGAEITALLQRIAGSQQAALAAWLTHAGQLGGLLAGVAELTVDGRAPDAALCLERLAKKVVRDGELSRPFAALAHDIAEWEELMGRCRAALDDGGALARAQARRRARRIAMGVSAGVIVLSGAAVAVQLVRFRARVQEVLDAPDACASLALTERDLDRVSADLAARVAGRRAECAAARAEAARIEEQRRAVAEREAQCAALAASLASGALSEADHKTAGDSAPLADRIARHALTADDFAAKEHALPCQDTPSGAAIAGALTTAFVTSPPVWTQEGFLSKPAREAIVGRRSDLSPIFLRDFDDRAEAEASHWIATGEPLSLDRAGRLCGLSAAFGMKTRGSCYGVLEIMKRRD